MIMKLEDEKKDLLIACKVLKDTSNTEIEELKAELNKAKCGGIN